MQNTNKTSAISGTTVVVCLTSILCITITAIVAVFIASPNTTDALARAGIITGFVGVFIPQMFLLVRTERVTQAVEQVKDDTSSLLNGGGQENTKEAVHTVMQERGLGTDPPDNPAVDPQPQPPMSR